MMKAAFSRRRFLRLTGGLALAGASLPLWAHDMAAMASGEEHPALRLAQPYKIKLAINKSAVCLAPVAVAEQHEADPRASLGGEQTIKSQGIIHGGAKYALHGALTGASEAIADMPRRWREALAGDGELAQRDAVAAQPDLPDGVRDLGVVPWSPRTPVVRPTPG